MTDSLRIDLESLSSGQLNELLRHFRAAGRVDLANQIYQILATRDTGRVAPSTPTPPEPRSQTLATSLGFNIMSRVALGLIGTSLAVAMLVSPTLLALDQNRIAHIPPAPAGVTPPRIDVAHVAPPAGEPTKITPPDPVPPSPTPLASPPMRAASRTVARPDPAPAADSDAKPREAFIAASGSGLPSTPCSDRQARADRLACEGNEGRGQASPGAQALVTALGAGVPRRVLQPRSRTLPAGESPPPATLTPRD